MTEFTSLFVFLQIQFNQTNVPDKASVQMNKPMDQIHYNQVLLQNYSAIPDCPAACETLPKKESVEMQFNQLCIPDKPTVQVNKPMDQIH